MVFSRVAYVLLHEVKVKGKAKWFFCLAFAAEENNLSEFVYRHMKLNQKINY